MPVISSIVDTPPGVPLIGYDNIVTTTNITSATAADGFPVTNLANPATHLIWKAGVNTGLETIDIVNSASAFIDYVAIAGHNFFEAGVQLAVDDVGVSPAAPLITTQPVSDDSPIIMRFPPSVYSQLRISITPANTVPQAAVIYVGFLLALERGIKVDVTHTPITYGRRTRIVNGMSESGNFLGRVVLSESRISRAEFFGFTPSFYRESIDPFLAAAQEAPFFWAWAPTNYPLETGYAWLTNNAVPEVSPDHLRIALSLDMAGVT